MFLRAIIMGFALLSFSYAVSAAPIGFFVPEGVEHDAGIPTPEAFLGHELGARPVSHDSMVAYLRAVVDLSDRMTIETIGYSHEQRPIEFLVITSPENHSRIDDIKKTHVALSDPSSGVKPSEDMPVVTWLNYGVHGAESAGMDAVIPVVYHLASAKGGDIERTLSESVILITAIFNPDGHTRRIDHVLKYSSAVPVTDPADAIHNLWVDARTNHYWFDLNRQWLLQTQPESRAWLAKWHEWKPNLTGDFHEMGSDSTYYFHPGVPKRKNPLIPDRSRDLLKAIGNYHAETLDRDGALYFSEEGFDNYYIGKGSTYPHINGSVGILFEAGAARGGMIETDNGLRTYAQNIRKHFLTSLSSIEGARALRKDLLDNQATFFQEARNLASSDRTKAYVFGSPDRGRLDRFLDLLARHKIDAYALSRDVDAENRTWRQGEAYVVPVAQAQYFMIKGMFDRVREFEEEIFYDVSGWTMPLAYDLDYAALSRSDWRDALMGAPTKMEKQSVPVPSEASYGYLIEWNDYYAPRALYRLLDAGLKVRGGLRPFRIETDQGVRDFERGTLFVPYEGQTKAASAQIYDLMRAVATEEGIPVYAVSSGHTQTAGSDLGGRDSFRSITKPSIMLLIDNGLDKYETGEAWHVLDYEMRIPVTLRRSDELGGINWSRYTHIILPGGRGRLDEKTSVRLERWIREEGGTLVALRHNAKWAQETLLRDKDTQDEDNKDASQQAATKRVDYADYSVEEARDVIGGAIFGSDLDISHPMAFGHYDRLIPSLRNTTLVLDSPKNPYATVARYLDEGVVMSGYASEKRASEISGTPLMIAERLGKGSVVLFADDPNFRATFLGTSRLFLNSLYWSRAFNAPRASEEAEAH